MFRNPALAVRSLVLPLLLALAVALGGAVAAAPKASALAVYSGDQIVVRFSNGDAYACTLNSVARKDGALWGITAGHCLSPIGGARPVGVYAADNATPIASDLRGSGVQFVGGRGANNFTDVAWFRLDGHVQDAGAARGGNYSVPFLGGNTPLTQVTRTLHPNRAIAGRLPVSALRIGQIVCKDGGTTGRTCGPVIRVNADSGEIWALMLSAVGDSGSPVYTLGPDRRAYIVGVHSRGGYGVLSVADAALPLPAGLR
ncbi:hypothetical protein [Corynebacterium sp. Marseille-P4321]|uniref:hypothetical protein n=1 Tax=Corynebacterium sp. Marseille-P4321 TaxID=2736603 RepID=UPI00158D52DF|nr:hypothetical protein [Corynebacterium sp. Marseille-P4321]